MLLPEFVFCLLQQGSENSEQNVLFVNQSNHSSYGKALPNPVFIPFFPLESDLRYNNHDMGV